MYYTILNDCCSAVKMLKLPQVTPITTCTNLQISHSWLSIQCPVWSVNQWEISIQSGDHVSTNQSSSSSSVVWECLDWTHCCYSPLEAQLSCLTCTGCFNITITASQWLLQGVLNYLLKGVTMTNNRVYWQKMEKYFTIEEMKYYLNIKVHHQVEIFRF